MNFISITENDIAKDNLMDFLQNKDFNFQILELGWVYKRDLRISSLPSNLFVDKKGIARDIQGNYPDQHAKPLDIEDPKNISLRL